MRALKLLVGLVAALVVSGCGSFGFANRDAEYERAFVSDTAFGLIEPVYLDVVPSYRVEEINVVVPDSLIVSEINTYYPPGDIVWHGDPPGDRHAQITAIFEEAFTRGTENLVGEVPVILDVTLERFHALTPKTRYTFGGVHSIRFTLAVREAETGLLVKPLRSVEANLKAYGGQRAIDAERQGRTQKVRITEHLAFVIQDELYEPVDFETERTGLFRAFANRF